MKRRDFLQSFALGAGALAAPRSLFASARSDASRMSKIGLELYAVRGAMKADPERTLAAIRAAGYDQVELLWSFGNFGRTPKQVKATLQREGLTAPSAHMAPETILKDWEKSLDTARLLGHQYLFVPSLPGETNTSLDAWRLWADRFNEAGAVARKAGIWLGFHNEPNHQTPIDNNIPYDVFIARTDPKVVRMQLDVGNMVMGGGDPFQYFYRFGDRYDSFHLKDTTPDRKHDTEIGNGIFDFRKFLSLIPSLDRKPCYVEQESPKDELASARANEKYLRSLVF